MTKKNLFIAILVVLGLILFVTEYSVVTRNSTKKSTNIATELREVENNEFNQENKPVGDYVPDNYITSEQLNEKFGINKTNAPSLFETYERNYGYRYLTAENFDIPNLQNLYLISSLVADHGGYSTEYALVYDLENKKIIYESDGLYLKGMYKTIRILDNGDIWLYFQYVNYEQGLSNTLVFEQYYRLDPGIMSFYSVNTDYIDKFNDEMFEQVNQCMVDYDNSIYLTFEETTELYGENFKCFTTGKYPFVGQEEVITPRRYFIYSKAIEDIRNGIEADLTKLNL